MDGLSEETVIAVRERSKTRTRFFECFRIAFFESLLSKWRVHDCWQVIVMSDGGVRSIGTQNEVPGTLWLWTLPLKAHVLQLPIHVRRWLGEYIEYGLGHVVLSESRDRNKEHTGDVKKRAGIQWFEGERTRWKVIMCQQLELMKRLSLDYLELKCNAVALR